MSQWIIEHLPTWLIAVIILVGLPVLAGGIQALLRRWAPQMRKGDHNDVAGFLVAVIGVTYAVIAAFTVIALWESFSEARGTSITEAGTLGDLVVASGAFGPDTEAEMRALATTYIETVRDEEWDSMVHGEENLDARRTVTDIAALLWRVEATTPADAAVLGSALDRFNDFRDARVERIDSAAEGIPGVIWLALLLSSAVTIGFCLLFGLEDARLHYVMVAGVTLIIAVNIFQILVLDHPFTGDAGVGPEALQHLLEDVGAGR